MFYYLKHVSSVGQPAIPLWISSNLAMLTSTAKPSSLPNSPQGHTL
ncbi:8148_t:CDS:2 [Funneliformis mosseae]|uniref:8148_t:CDS:1 n=1 Tax=Funneliformis mosseae TaxID=27381 RepID=A0A9N8ZNZ8_FUNMO|nr:8148_t:CDS:2 [Funneliformis mosseae]